MQRYHSLLLLGLMTALLSTFAMSGCRRRGLGSIEFPNEPIPLGSGVDSILQMQEDLAEKAKLVIYTHEFELDKGDDRRVRGHRLNDYGQDHVRELARRLVAGEANRIIVERSETSSREDTVHEYPVHFNDDLDARRRKVVVLALVALGVENADDMVFVAPAFSEGLNSEEAAGAYERSFGNNQNNGGGGGGGFGGSR